jgi:phage baseplate assembly protein W
MGKIVLGTLPQLKDRIGPYLYTDLHLDLELSDNINNFLYQENEIKDIKLDYDLNAIRNSLHNLFTTTPGEKILNPDYGLDLRQYLFQPATIEVAENIRDEIYRQVRVYESRVKVNDVAITILEDVNEFDISIYYSIPTLNISKESMFGTLGGSGFIIRN